MYVDDRSVPLSTRLGPPSETEPCPAKVVKATVIALVPVTVVGGRESCDFDLVTGLGTCPLILVKPEARVSMDFFVCDRSGVSTGAG